MKNLQKSQKIIIVIPFTSYEKIMNLQFETFKKTEKHYSMAYFVNQAINQYLERENKPHQKREVTK